MYTLHSNMFDTRWLELMRGCRLKSDIFFADTLKYFIHKKLKFHIVQEPFSINFTFMNERWNWLDGGISQNVKYINIVYHAIDPGILHGEWNTFHTVQPIIFRIRWFSVTDVFQPTFPNLKTNWIQIHKIFCMSHI